MRRSLSDVFTIPLPPVRSKKRRASSAAGNFTSSSETSSFASTPLFSRMPMRRLPCVSSNVMIFPVFSFSAAAKRFPVAIQRFSRTSFWAESNAVSICFSVRPDGATTTFPDSSSLIFRASLEKGMVIWRCALVTATVICQLLNAVGLSPFLRLMRVTTPSIGPSLPRRETCVPGSKRKRASSMAWRFSSARAMKSPRRSSSYILAARFSTKDSASACRASLSPSWPTTPCATSS